MTSPAPYVTSPYVTSVVDQAYIGLTMLLRTLRVWSARDEGLDESPSKLLYIALGIICLLYTSDAADERSSVDLCGRRIIQKKK